MKNKKGKKNLTDEQYRICVLGGTETPFNNEYWDHKEVGIYRCICCEAALFHSQDKFDSGSGWPSYFQPTSPDAIKQLPDDSYNMHRVEVRCAQCDAHLGHVFPDGPPPTHLRYCINSAALRFEKGDPNEI